MNDDEIQHANHHLMTLGMSFLKLLIYLVHLSGVIRSSQNFFNHTISSSLVFDVTCFLRYKVCPLWSGQNSSTFSRTLLHDNKFPNSSFYTGMVLKVTS